MTFSFMTFARELPAKAMLQSEIAIKISLGPLHLSRTETTGGKSRSVLFRGAFCTKYYSLVYIFITKSHELRKSSIFDKVFQIQTTLNEVIRRENGSHL
jgi:hypothetical protein